MDEQIDYDPFSVPELAAHLKSLKERLDDAAADKTLLQKQFDYLSIQVLPDRMDEENISSVVVPDVGRLQMKSDIRCNVLAANREAVQKWLIDNGHGSMVNPTINSGTFKAFVKERMKEGKEYPVDLVNVEPYSRASVVKVVKK